MHVIWTNYRVNSAFFSQLPKQFILFISFRGWHTVLREIRNFSHILEFLSLINGTHQWKEAMAIMTVCKWDVNSQEIEYTWSVQLMGNLQYLSKTQVSLEASLLMHQGKTELPLSDLFAPTFLYKIVDWLVGSHFPLNRLSTKTCIYLKTRQESEKPHIFAQLQQSTF